MSVAWGPEYVLTLTCPDKPGIVDAMSSLLVAAHDGAQVLVIPANSAGSPLSRLMELQAVRKDLTLFRALLPECYVVFVNRVGTEGELVVWGGSHVVNPRGRMVAGAPLYTEQLVTVDLDLAKVGRHRREEPLLENPRLDLLLQELGRLTTNRQEAGVHRGDGLLVA
jgi:predicted amidohydrolase